MAIDIATTLYVRDRKTDLRASLVDIAHVVGIWAEIPEPEWAVDGGRWTALGRRRATVEAEKLDLGAGEAWGWRMRLEHPDSEDRTLQWIVEIEAVEDPAVADTKVAVTVGRMSRDGDVRAVRTDRPAPPGVIAELVEHPAVDCIDGPIPLTAKESVLARAAVEAFVDEVLLVRDRRLPVIGVSVPPAGRPPLVDAEKLARQLAGMAHVWIVPPDTAWALSERLPEGLGVYNGAVRIWWPGLDATSDRDDHPLWRPGTTTRALEEIVGVVTRSARGRFTPLAEIERLREEIRQRERDQLCAELHELRQLVKRADEEHRRASDQRVVDSLETRIRELTRQQEHWFEEALRLEAQLRERDEELDRARDENRQMLYENRALKRHLQRAGSDPGPTTLLEDPVEAFLEEVRAEYEERFTSDDRTRWPLREMRLHPDFLQALDRLEGISREKVVSVCAEVASGRAWTIPARDVHGLRVGRGGGDPQRVRGRDGAKAWRCSLQTDTPSARRLHWWDIPGGAIEFAHVGLHDDERCPE